MAGTPRARGLVKCHAMTVRVPQQSLEEAEFPLGEWYAEPLSAPEAEALLARVHQARQRALSAGRDCRGCGVYEMIARFWLQRPVEPLYQTLLRLPSTDRDRAVLHLVYGQLLASRKLTGALEALRRGFGEARSCLGASEYFDVMRRHELLAELPFTAAGAPPQGLQALLREAAVIRALRGRRSGRPPGDPPGDPADTLG